MNLVELKIKGFMSYRHEAHIKFSPGITYITGENISHNKKIDSNGGGKSAILYAICWMLWSNVPPGGNKNDLIHWDAKAVHGELALEGVGGQLKIVRTKARTGSESLTFWYNGQEFGGDFGPTQEKLESFYGVSWEVFCNAVFIGPTSKTTAFFSATPGKRAELLAELIDDSEFQDAAKRMGTDIINLERQRDNTLIGIQSVEKEKAHNEQQVIRLAAQIAQEKLKKKDADDKRNQEIERLLEEQAKKKRLLAEKAPGDNTEIQVQLNRARDTISQQNQVIGGLRSILSRTSFSPGDECPTCHQAVTVDTVAHLQQEQAKARQAQAEAQEVIALQHKLCGNLEQALQKIRTWHQDRNQAAQDVKRLQERIVALRSPGEDRALEHLMRERQIASDRITELEQALTAHRRKVAGIQQKLPVLKTIQTGFRQEIRNMLLDKVRQLLIYYTDKYRWLLAESEFGIEFPPQSKTGREKFEIYITTAGQRNPLASTGQAWRATFAVLLSLRRVLTHGNHCLFDFFLIDDPFHGGLDDSGIRTVTELLNSLTAEIPTVLVTLPREVAGMAGGTHLRVQRKDYVSTLV